MTQPSLSAGHELPADVCDHLRETASFLDAQRATLTGVLSAVEPLTAGPCDADGADALRELATSLERFANTAAAIAAELRLAAQREKADA